jgi:3D (Asp-Asp-Asp) domain-containing protein
MKPLFTIHEGEFLVGDHINRKLGNKFDVWVPTKDSGVEFLARCP